MRGLALLGCAGTDDGTPRRNRGAPSGSPPADADPLRQRLGHALELVKRRPVLTTHSFWSIFHAILGAGPDLQLLDPATGKKYVALDYLLLGGKPRGMGFAATPFGIEVPTVGSAAGFWEHEGQGHQDQFLAEMIQQGLAPTAKSSSRGRSSKARDFTRGSQARVRLKAGQELGWAIVAIGQHFGTDCEWTNRFGEKLRYEDLIAEEVAAPIDGQACGGTRRLFGLAWAYHLHRTNCANKKTTPGPLWEGVGKRLDEHVAIAKRLQNPDGSFSAKYSAGPGRGRTRTSAGVVRAHARMAGAVRAGRTASTTVDDAGGQGRRQHDRRAAGGTVPDRRLLSRRPRPRRPSCPLGAAEVSFDALAGESIFLDIRLPLRNMPGVG